MIPTFKLFDSTGTVLKYTFPAVNYTNAPQSVENFIEHETIKSKGSLIVEGGESSWDLIMRFTLLGDGYEEVTSLIDDLEDKVRFNTPYVLVIAKSPTTSYQYKVKRLQSFEYVESLRLQIQKVSCILKVNVW